MTKTQRQSKPGHERKYHGKPSFTFPVWNGILEHREKIGPAIWEFLWCLDKVTFEDEDGIGWCLGKTPIDTKRIADDLNEHQNTAYANMERLAADAYIVRKRTPRGYCIGVVNSRKFSARRKSDSEKTPNRESQETVTQSGSSESQETPNHSKVNHSFQGSDSQKTISRRDFAVDFAVESTLQTPLPPYPPSHKPRKGERTRKPDPNTRFERNMRAAGLAALALPPDAFRPTPCGICGVSPCRCPKN